MRTEKRHFRQKRTLLLDINASRKHLCYERLGLLLFICCCNSLFLDIDTFNNIQHVELFNKLSIAQDTRNKSITLGDISNVFQI